MSKYHKIQIWWRYRVLQSLYKIQAPNLVAGCHVTISFDVVESDIVVIIYYYYYYYHICYHLLLYIIPVAWEEGNE